jgi:hypothetical protein
MKYGVIPTNPAEAAAILAEQVPVPMVDAVFGMMKSRGIMAAVELGLFEAMREGPSTPEEIAARKGLDPGCVELLLRWLSLMGYTEIHGDRFSLTRLARRTLLEGSPGEMIGFLKWNYVQWEIVMHLEELLKTGKGLDFHRTMTEPDRWASYQRGMLEIARKNAAFIARRVPVRSGATRLLDIAGSHGLIGAAICRRHKGLRSTVLDLPAALDHARALAKKEGIDDLVSHKEGDMLKDDFGSGWDVVLLSNIIHHFLPDQIVDILKRVKRASSPGGAVAIWDFEVPRRGAKPGPGDAAALLFRLTSNAAAYRAEDYRGWIRKAGFEDIRTHRTVTIPGNVLLTAHA